jgi:hypothetical protein
MQGAQGDNRYEARKPDSPQVAQMRSIMRVSPLRSISASSRLAKSFLNLSKTGIADVQKRAKKPAQFPKSQKAASILSLSAYAPIVINGSRSRAVVANIRFLPGISARAARRMHSLPLCRRQIKSWKE